jgi:hypothetical protein
MFCKVICISNLKSIFELNSSGKSGQINLRGKLFWGVKNDSSKPNGNIVRANLDGSGQEDWVTDVNPNAMQAVWIKL